MTENAGVIHKPWRCGGQVGRTLYVDAGEKDPADLFGLVDNPEIAMHIVRVHNWWLYMKRLGEEAWAAECEEFGCHDPEDG